MRFRALLLVLLVTASAEAATYGSGGPHTTNNDDACDVAVMPAATLLLPWFEVDITSPAGSGATTYFNVANVTGSEAVARVTLWTDYAYPVVSFNVFLTGYDTQSIDLYDVIALGQIAPTRGTGFEDSGSPEGYFSSDTANPLVEETTCRNLLVNLGDLYRTRVQQALTQGRVPALGVALPTCNRVGGTHSRAVGYATIDVVSRCGTLHPGDPAYYEDELLFDNVLTGDYRHSDPEQKLSRGGPLVHIRAIPEGGTAASRAADPERYASNLESTFYGRYQPATMRPRDGRQPLPSVFATRWISGGPGDFRTDYSIWREGVAAPESDCDAFAVNGSLDVAEIVRFDEDENFTAFEETEDFDTPRLAAASRVDADDLSIFPPAEDDAIAGWMYLNLDHNRIDGPGDGRAAQAWMTTAMYAGNVAVDVEAAALANGCTAPIPPSDATSANGAPIGPPRAPAIAHSRGWPRSTGNDDSCDIAVLPAATLLLPYFEVDLAPTGQTTLFTVMNVSEEEHIAHVTLWTEYAFPVLDFNIHLTGYDVQSINLRDVLHGRVAAGCDGTPETLPPPLVARVRHALTGGAIAGDPACAAIGKVHTNAIGYATIDVVGSCTSLRPSDATYYTEALRFDNVLSGDYQQIANLGEHAEGASLVHIRAVPEEGGTVNLPWTFYGRYLAPGVKIDRRQPLPSAFAAHWGHAHDFSDTRTAFKVWREGVASTALSCETVRANARLPLVEVVTFDSEENALGTKRPCEGPCSPPPPPGLSTPAVFLTVLESGEIFNEFEDELAGWIYMNLSGEGQRPMQAWVIASKFPREGGHSAGMHATAMANGCSPTLTESDVNEGRGTIGPGANVNP